MASAGDTTWTGDPGTGSSASPGKEESLLVPQPQGRGFRAGDPGLLALREQGGRRHLESGDVVNRGTGTGCQAGEEGERGLEGPPRGWGGGSGLSLDSPGAQKSGAAATPVPQSLPGTPGRTFPSSPRLLSSEEPGAGGAGGGTAAEGTASCLKSF